jgi:ParB-like nuclease domain
MFGKARLATLRATGMPIVDARDDFQRARRAYHTGRAARLLSGRRRCRGVPRSLADAEGLPRRAGRLEVIPLAAVVGTLEPTALFDERFRPASELARRRWERIALAHRKGEALPPIEVLERPDGYYVVDGRHRVSVALALGHRDIDAYVTRTAALPAQHADHFRLAA